MKKLSPQVVAYATMLQAMHKMWQPHSVQIPPGLALFNEGIKRIFLRFGRQTGKSELMAYMAVRWALSNPGARVAIICPLLKQCRSLYMHSRTLERKIPAEYLDSIHTTDGRFMFKNGSMIELHGVDNPEAFRGFTASIVFADEAKDLTAYAIDSVIEPTLLVQKAPFIIAGTPPELATHFYWDFLKQAETDPDWRIFKATSYDNPYIDHEDLNKVRARLEARGEGDAFQREYMSEFVPGQKKMVFPMLSDAHIKPYDELMHEVRKNCDRWNYYAVLDPGTASVFALLFAAVNSYDGRIRLLDELYINQQSENSIGKIWPRAQEKMKTIYDEDPGEGAWTVIYDEAASWCRNELQDRYEVNAIPTQKSVNKKGAGISAIRDVLFSKHLLASDRMVQWRKEMLGYQFDDRGVPVKKDDHLVDTTLYLLPAAFYTAKESAPPVEPAPLEPGQIDDKKRAFTPYQDMAADNIDMFGEQWLFDEPDWD